MRTITPALQLLQDFRKAVLVYQGGIANVFAVQSFGESAGKRTLTYRLLQSDFNSCATYAHGLRDAGIDVCTMACNQAGDVREQTWTSDLDSAPWNEKFAVFRR